MESWAEEVPGLLREEILREVALDWEQKNRGGKTRFKGTLRGDLGSWVRSSFSYCREGEMVLAVEGWTVDDDEDDDEGFLGHG